MYVDSDVLIWHLRGERQATRRLRNLADALLAASALTTGGKILTRNLRHYPMPEVVVEKAW